MTSRLSRMQIDRPDCSTRGGTKRKQREFVSRESINSTQSLIDLYNQETNEVELCAMRDWLYCYVDWFAKQSIETLNAEDAQEFALIGQLTIRSPHDEKLLNSWFCCLCNAAHGGRFGEEKIVSALEIALLTVDKRIFKGDPSVLLKLSDSLLSKLDPAKTVFEKATYGTLRGVLSALHLTFVAIQEVSPKLLDPKDKDGVYQVFKQRLEKIAELQNYFPILYQVMLIGQSLKQLEQGKKILTLTSALSRLYHGAVAALCISEAIRGLASLEYRHDAFEAGYQHMQQAFLSLRISQRPWYEGIQALSTATLLASEYPEEYPAFETCYNELTQNLSALRKEDRRAVRFGIIDQLQLLILHTLDERVRTKSLEMLLELAKKKEKGRWADKASILEALLDAMGTVYGVCTQKEAVEAALQSMSPYRKAASRKIFIDWLGPFSIRCKLQSFRQIESTPPADRLFCLIKNENQICRDVEVVQGSLEELKALYLTDRFAMVKSLFDGEEPKRVSSFQFNLVRYTKVNSNKQQDYSMENYDRKNMTTQSIELKDLFPKTSVKLNKHLQEINKVLLVGNPGTGKTTISKKLAMLWASGKWGDEFDAVYMLQVRAVSDAFYDGSNLRHSPTLAAAIANSQFHWRRDEEFSSLYKQIREKLQRKTTLLILDGLDESDGASNLILQEAKHCACKLLMLTRPYNLHQERQLADIEVECLGLSDKQLTNFVKEELSRQGSKQFLGFLKQSRSIWDIAHVPVTINILCFLWKEDSEALVKENFSGSLLMLYMKMTHFTWHRYSQKYKMEDVDREEVFRVLGRIAFDALKDSQVLIKQTLVKKHATNSKLENVLKNCGFLLLQPEGILYQFPHATFEEYFAGRHLTTYLFEGSSLDRRSARKFIAENKYNAKYRVMLSFVAEEVRRAQPIDTLVEFTSAVDLGMGPNKIMDMQQVSPKLRFPQSSLSIPLGQSDTNLPSIRCAPAVGAAAAQTGDTLAEYSELEEFINGSWNTKILALSLEEKNLVLENELIEKETELRSLRAQLEEAKKGSGNHTDTPNIGKKEGWTKPVEVDSSPAKLLHNKVKDLRKYLKNNKLGSSYLVNPLDDSIPKKDVDGIYHLVGEVCLACMRLIRHDGPDLWDLIAASLEKKGGSLDCAIWHSIAGSLKLHEKQVASALNLRDRHLAKLEKIFIRRRALNLEAIQHLALAEGSGPVPMSTQLGCVSSSSTFVQTLHHSAKLNVLFDRIKENLSEEKKLNSELAYMTFYIVLGPVQSAWFMVKAYPYQCDCLEFLNAVKEVYVPTAELAEIPTKGD